MFSEEERKEYIEDGLTDDEIDLLESSLAMSETVKMIPDDIEAFLEEYKAKIPADTLNGMKALAYAVEKEPEFFKKLMALDIALDYDISKNQGNEQKQFPVLEGLTDEEYETAKKNYKNTLSKLTESDRNEFLKLMVNLTSEQKTDMIERLKG